MASAPFGFGWLRPAAPGAPDDEAVPAGLAPGQMPVDPRRDGSRQPTAADAALSRAIGATLASTGEGAGAVVDAFTKPPSGPTSPALPFSLAPAAPQLDPWETPAGPAPGQPPVDPRRDGMVQPNTLGRAMQHAVGAKAVGAARGLVDVASLPGDVNAGRTDPLSDEGIRRAFDLAGTLVTGGMPMAEAGAAGIFGGRLSRGANREALAEAQDLAAQGIGRKDIWTDTGWFQGPDNHWRYEIPDNASRYGGSSTTIGGALDHPDAFAAYPGLAGIGHSQPTTLADNTLGLYHPRWRGDPERIEVAQTHAGESIPTPQRHDTALHEVQHAVQAREGTLGNSSPQPSGADYWTSWPEVEARNVERRRTWSDTERRSVAPWESADVAWPQPAPGDAYPRHPTLDDANPIGESFAARAPMAKVSGEGAPGSGPIRAYHGSPHSFDRFDSRRIGTGEGIAEQGHGLYFAGDARTAQLARDTLSPVVMRDAAGLDVSPEAFAETLRAAATRGLDGAQAERAATIADRLAAGLGRTEPGSLADRLPGMRTWGRRAYGDDFPAYDRALDAARQFTPASAGRMYEVAIGAKPSDLLPWDRGADPYRALAERLGSSQAASDELLRQGIPGIRYADPHTPGSQNYVMFSGEPVTILRKYGVAGAVGAGGTATALAPDDAEAASSSPAPPAIPFGPVPMAWTSSNLSDRIVGAESGGNATAKNPRSSATGAGQFIDGTWLDMVRRYRPDLAGLPRDQVLALRNDAGLSREMVGHYADENGAKLRSAGLPDTDGSRYLAHFAGPAGARAVLSADPSTPAAQVLQPGQVAANPFVRNMTVGQLADWAARKVGSDAPTMRMPGGSSAPGALGLSGPTQGAAPFSMAPAGGAAMTMPADSASAGPGIASLLRVLMEEPAAASQAQAAPAPAPTSAPFGFAPLAAMAQPASRPIPFDYEKFVSLLRPRRPTR